MVQQQDSDDIFINSRDFFLNEVGADESIFLKYPLLGTFKVEGDLRPKYNFFRNYIGMKSKNLVIFALSTFHFLVHLKNSIF